MGDHALYGLKAVPCTAVKSAACVANTLPNVTLYYLYFLVISAGLLYHEVALLTQQDMT